DVLYAGYPTLYVSYDRAGDWSPIRNSSLPYYDVPGNWCISTCPTNSTRLYAAGRNEQQKGLFRVEYLGTAVPDEVTNLISGLVDQGHDINKKITDIAVSSNTSARLWVTVGGFHDSDKVFYSNNFGADWTNLSIGLPNFPVNAVVADDNDNIYVGTDVGVFYRGATDNTWTPFYNRLPRVAVSDLEIFTAFGSSSIYASTYGRGIWISEPFSSCVAELTISSTQTGQKFFQAGNSINSTALIDGGYGTNVFYKAGTEIVLAEGTEVKPGAELRAFIGACNSGIPMRIGDRDSMVNVTRNIRSARQFGFVKNAIKHGNEVEVTLDIFKDGNYTIRIYDADEKTYLSSVPVTINKGMNTLALKTLVKAADHNLRADLFSADMLVHYTDVSGK
ncbi:MAG TPA: hypothetical protein VHL77_06750, partial [Ferruginibacter sp.]|nr:hypothetical protein [Ferruginibacter sp.]